MHYSLYTEKTPTTANKKKMKQKNNLYINIFGHLIKVLIQ